MEIQVKCGEFPACGFRVHDEYYAQKRRFPPRLCANCHGIIEIVRADTNSVAEGYQMNDEGRVRLVVAEGK